MRKELSERVAVSGQIDPTDFEDIAAAGFNVVVDSRPDAEIPDGHHAAAMKSAAEAAGLSFHYIPMTPGSIPSEQDAAAFLGALHQGKVFAYCGGGPRAIILASFAAASEGQPLETIVSQAAALGIDLGRVKPLLIERGAKET